MCDQRHGGKGSNYLMTHPFGIGLSDVTNILFIDWGRWDTKVNIASRRSRWISHVADFCQVLARGMSQVA